MKACLFGIAGLLLSAVPAFAQTSASHGVWVDVSFVAFFPRQQNQIYTRELPRFGEVESARATYPEMSGAGVRIGGGIALHRRFGVGVFVTPIRSEYTVGLEVRLPSPIFFNAFGADEGETATLTRQDLSVDMSVTYDLLTRGAWQLRVFGGPTYFRVSQEMVTDIAYSQTFTVLTPTNIVDITGYSEATRSASGFGAHGGADLSYAFSRMFGVHGTVSFNAGRATIDEPLSSEAVTLKLGGVSAGAGIRVRF